MPQNQNQAPEQISKKMMFESGHYRMIDVNIYLSDKPVFRYGLNKKCYCGWPHTAYHTIWRSVSKSNTAMKNYKANNKHHVLFLNKGLR